MQLLKRVKWVYVVLSVFLAGLGVCLFVWPDIPAVTVCCAIGGGAVVLGIFKIVLYFLREINAVGEQNDFAIGAMCVIAGAILLIHPNAILDMVPQVLGVYMLIDCVFKLQIALDAKRLGNKGWWLSLAVTLLCIIWGLLLIWQPFGLNEHLMVLIAGGLIADGVQNLLGVVYMAATVRRLEAEGGEITEPAAIEEVPDGTPEPVIPVSAPEEALMPAEKPAPKKKFSLFGKKDGPKEETKPAPESEPEEDDGAVAEINFEMTEEETHELHS